MKDRLTKKQLIIIILAAALVVAAGVLWFVLGRDSGEETTSPQQLEPPTNTEELMARAVAEFSAMDSFQLDTDMSMTMTVSEEAMEMKMLLTNFYKKDADIQKAVSTMTVGNMGSYSTNYYAEKKGNSYVLYASVDGGIEWTKQTVETEEELPTGDPSAEILRFLTEVENYQEVASEEISGVTTTQYECVLSADDMKETFKASGLFEQIGTDMSEEEMAAVYDSMGEMRFSVWIGQEDYLPYRMYMDMGNLINTMSRFADIDETQKEMLDTLSNVTMTYNISNYNQLGEIELPKEAKNASEAE